MTTETLELAPADAPDIETLARADAPAIWDDYRAKLEKLKATAETLTEDDVKDKAKLAIVTTTRKAFKSLRVEVEHRRKELGEEALRRKQKIDSAAREIVALIEPYEERMLALEQAEARAEAARVLALHDKRCEELEAVGVDPHGLNPGEMTEETFSVMLAGFVAQREAKRIADEKAEAERIAKEKADAEERERQRVENERLKAEAAEREAALAKEQAARDAKAKAERDALEAEAARLREIAAEAEREVARRQAEAEAQEAAKKAEADKAAKAPDREKLLAFASNLRALEFPTLSTDAGKAVVEELISQAGKFAAWVEKKAGAM